jgi:hypothetical protein
VNHGVIHTGQGLNLALGADNPEFPAKGPCHKSTQSVVRFLLSFTSKTCPNFAVLWNRIEWAAKSITGAVDLDYMELSIAAKAYFALIHLQGKATVDEIATCRNVYIFCLRSAHFKIASSAGHSAWPHAVRLYSTLGGTSG